MFISCPSPFNVNLENVCSRAKSYENGPQISKISAKCTIPDINDLEDYVQGHMASFE